MNVLILPSWYPIPENPISGIFFKEQALALKKKFEQENKNDKIFVAFVEEFGIRSFKIYLKRKKNFILEEDGIMTIRTKYLRIPKLHKLNLYRGSRCVKKIITKFSKFLKLKFDLIHIHSALNAGIWYSLSKINIPYVITEHSTSYSANLISKQGKIFLPSVFNKAKRIIAVGNGLSKEIKKYTNNNVDVIFNIVNSELIEIEKNISNNKYFSFFSIGLNANKKGFDILLLAFQKLILSGFVAKLTIAGLNEDEKEWLLSLNIEKEVLEHVCFKGRLDRNSVFEHMRNCDCFSLVSRFETFGVVFAEAMYCGKPVIAPRTGGPDSFVNEKNGISVDVNDVEATTKAMQYMIENVSKYDSNEIRQYAIDNFSEDVICEKLYNIYKMILEKK